jgi:hypothetical protein
VPGFPSPAEGPAYPQHLRDTFAERRWIEADDRALLDYEGARILLLGAHAHDVEDELGIEIDEEVETRDSAEIYRTLQLRNGAGTEPLFRGEFPAKELPPPGETVDRRGGRGRRGPPSRRVRAPDRAVSSGARSGC